MYCDVRIFGCERWHSSPPPDHMLRLPDAIRNAVCFLAVKTKTGYTFGGTGFFVSHTEKTQHGPWETMYLATAKHCVEQAMEKFGNLHSRFNLRNGETITVQLHGPWIKSKSSDVAIMPLDDGLDVVDHNVPTESFLNDERIKEYNFGIGDEIFITGLFTKRFGISRNIPILRTGIVAAMAAEEPIQGSKDPLPFNAYLLEVRSLGGLSGSPVFTIIHRGVVTNRPPRHFSPLVHQIALVGIIRGHWDTISGQDSDLYKPIAGEILNSGIALATPAQELLTLIESEEATSMRLKEASEASGKRNPVEDSEFSDETQFTKDDFENALKRASRRIQPSQPDEGKSKT